MSSNIQTINDLLEIEFDENRKMMIPQSLPPYQIQKVIHEAEHCIILSSSHDQTQAKVAIKCIPFEFYCKSQKEDEIMKSLNIENIIKFIDSFAYPSQSPRFYAIVMALADTDLYDYIKFQEFLEEPKVCKIMNDILVGVDYLHSNQIWHRDLKPENIFINYDNSNDPHALIGDLGSSDTISEQTITGDPFGSIDYAAPELLYLDKNNLSFKKLVTCLFYDFNHI